MRAVLLCLSLIGCVGAPEVMGPDASGSSSAGGDPSGDPAPGTSADADDGEPGDGSTTANDEAGSSEEGDEGSGDEGESGEPVDSCPDDGETFPTATWPEGDPEDFGIDPAALEAAAAYAGEQESRCLVVIRDGHLVFEQYWQDTHVDEKIKTYSIAKSYTSTLVGQAIADGFIDGVEDPVDAYLPELAGTDATLRNLLTMTSGYYEGIIDDYVLLTFSSDQSQHALATLQGDPAGAAWQYSNVGVQLLEPLLERTTGMAVDAYAEEKLWGPLGIDAEWDQDGSGNVETYQNVRASCRDHAKFGYLYLKRGCWDGERIIEEEWIDEATTTSQDLNRGYGYLFWIMGQEPTLTSVNFDEVPGGLQPFAPDGTFAARGLGGQMIEVIPELDMVIMRGAIAPQDDPALITDPLALIDALVNGNDDEITGNIVQLILDGVD